jgi:hypothetical protein
LDGAYSGWDCMKWDALLQNWYGKIDNYKFRFEFLFYTHLLTNFGANTRWTFKKIIFSMHIYKKCGFSLVIASENTQYHLEHPFYMNFSYNSYF